MPNHRSPIQAVLARVPRRYRIPADPARLTAVRDTPPSMALALSIDGVRAALERGEVPGESLKRTFLHALGSIIRDAMHPEYGDAAFQAMVLRHQFPVVDEYVARAALADQDRRAVQSAVNAVAHPGKRQRMPRGPLTEALARLHILMVSASWSELASHSRGLAMLPDLASDPALDQMVRRLQDEPALTRLRELEALRADPRVQEYLALWEQQGPRAGSATAAARGAASRQRGADVEQRTAQALKTLISPSPTPQDSGSPYRVVTSMRVPSALVAGAAHAKSEWDVVLLKQASAEHTTPTYDLCLLIEAKASSEAAATDLPRLMRGLQCLANAQADETYGFDTQQGAVVLQGASLKDLIRDDAPDADRVLYCCDGAADDKPRLLTHANRMQLLSDAASLAFAVRLSGGDTPDLRALDAVWEQLLSSPRWEPLRQQYPLLHRVRELMVHLDDLTGELQ